MPYDSPFQHRELSGSSFAERKHSDKAPDLQGEVMIRGELWGLATWKRQTKKGGEMMSHRLTEPAEHAKRKADREAYRQQRNQLPAAPPPEPIPQQGPAYVEPLPLGDAGDMSNVPF